MSTFYQPKELINGLQSSSDLKYAYESAGNQRCLFSSCALLGELQTYVSANYRSATPSTYGCWFPTVSSQSELNSNYTLITNSSSGFAKYLFFKDDETGTSLYQATTLSSAYANGVLVPVEDQPLERITPTNFGNVKLQLQDDDGPVIIVGILDSIDPKRG